MNEWVNMQMTYSNFYFVKDEESEQSGGDETSQAENPENKEKPRVKYIWNIKLKNYGNFC